MMLISPRFIALCALCVSTTFLTLSCTDTATTSQNTLTKKEKDEGWKLLFDGQSAEHWHIYNKKNNETPWVIKQGELYCDPNSSAPNSDLISNDTYKNFEFRFEWKIEANGNGGIFINVLEHDSIPAPWTTGLEYQLLGVKHQDVEKPTKRSGTLYTFAPQLNQVANRPTDEWNESSIIQRNDSLQFFLNGTKTVEIDFKSKEWSDMLASSHFTKGFADYGKNRKGKIGLQDWTRGVSFRNLKIKQL